MCKVVNSQLSVQYQAGSWSGRLVKGTLEFGGIEAEVGFVEISEAKRFFSFPQYTQGTLGMAYRGNWCVCWIAACKGLSFFRFRPVQGLVTGHFYGPLGV